MSISPSAIMVQQLRLSFIATRYSHSSEKRTQYSDSIVIFRVDKDCSSILFQRIHSRESDNIGYRWPVNQLSGHDVLDKKEATKCLICPS